ncbi:MAG: MGMT family protein [Anaerolineaceae bacterium]|nr:MGMT family protein [Anaerolineaceae bacterium]
MKQDTSPTTPLYQRIYAVVRQVPPGKVATYGQIAEIIGCSARMVGYAMAALKHIDAPDVPWQRVVNRLGKISILDPFGKSIQRQILEEEGIVFSKSDQIDFREYGWIQ